jgi:hypothetical protein
VAKCSIFSFTRKTFSLFAITWPAKRVFPDCCSTPVQRLLHSRHKVYLMHRNRGQVLSRYTDHIIMWLTILQTKPHSMHSLHFHVSVILHSFLLLRQLRLWYGRIIVKLGNNSAPMMVVEMTHDFLYTLCYQGRWTSLCTSYIPRINSSSFQACSWHSAISVDTLPQCCHLQV